jgi:hypothetical protein
MFVLLLCFLDNLTKIPPAEIHRHTPPPNIIYHMSQFEEDKLTIMATAALGMSSRCSITLRRSGRGGKNMVDPRGLRR